MPPPPFKNTRYVEWNLPVFRRWMACEHGFGINIIELTFIYRHYDWELGWACSGSRIARNQAFWQMVIRWCPSQRHQFNCKSWIDAWNVTRLWQTFCLNLSNNLVKVCSNIIRDSSVSNPRFYIGTCRGESERGHIEKWEFSNTS